MKTLQFKKDKIAVAMYAEDDAPRFNYQWIELTPFSFNTELLNWIASSQVIAPDFTMTGWANGNGKSPNPLYNFNRHTLLSIEHQGYRYRGTFYDDSGDFLRRQYFMPNELSGLLTAVQIQIFPQQDNGQ